MEIGWKGMERNGKEWKGMETSRNEIERNGNNFLSTSFQLPF
jgi:hypothetical protein